VRINANKEKAMTITFLTPESRWVGQDAQKAVEAILDQSPLKPRSPMPFERANAARLQKALDRQYHFAASVMTLGEWIRRTPLTHKRIWVQEYSDHRINYEYAKYDPPKVHYMLCLGDAEWQVPKIVYDSLDLPLEWSAQVYDRTAPRFDENPHASDDPWPQCATCPVKAECNEDPAWVAKNCPGGDEDEVLSSHSVGCA
jgi:hypothetical protein